MWEHQKGQITLSGLPSVSTSVKGVQFASISHEMTQWVSKCETILESWVLFSVYLLVPHYTWTHWGRAYPQHISTEQVHSGWMNCYKNLLSNLILRDLKRFPHFIDGEKTEHRVQRVAWQRVTEPGTFRPDLMTFPLDSTTQATLAGVESHCSVDTINLSLWLTETTHQPLTLSHGPRWTWDLKRKQSCPVEQVCQGSLRPEHRLGNPLCRVKMGQVQRHHARSTPLSQECLKDNT